LIATMACQLAMCLSTSSFWLLVTQQAHRIIQRSLCAPREACLRDFACVFGRPELHNKLALAPGGLQILALSTRQSTAQCLKQPHASRWTEILVGFSRNGCWTDSQIPCRCSAGRVDQTAAARNIPHPVRTDHAHACCTLSWADVHPPMVRHMTVSNPLDSELDSKVRRQWS
jgi:hypothetical protein